MPSSEISCGRCTKRDERLARAGVESGMRKVLMGHSLAADVTEANYVDQTSR